MKLFLDIARLAAQLVCRVAPACTLVLLTSCAATSQAPRERKELPHTPVSLIFTAPQGARVTLNGEDAGAIPCRAAVTSYSVVSVQIEADDASLAAVGATAEQVAAIKKLGHERLRGQLCVGNYDAPVSFELSNDDFLWSLTTGGEVTVGSRDGALRFKGSPDGVSSSDAFVLDPIRSADEQLNAAPSQGVSTGGKFMILLLGAGLALWPLFLL